MNAFKDFGIETNTETLAGDKIKINKILNKEITVTGYRVAESKYPEKGNGKCLHLQFRLGDKLHILFTGSVTLIDMIQKVPKDKIPFTTIIIEENERFQFT